MLVTAASSSTNSGANVLIAVAVVVWLLARQLRVRPAREQPRWAVLIVLAALGVVQIGRAMQDHHPGSDVLMLLGVSLVVGAVLGLVRARTVRIWRAPDGALLRQGTTLTLVLWVVSIAIHIGLDAIAAGRPGSVPGLGAASILLYLAVTWSAQAWAVAERATALAPSVPDAARR